MIDLKLAAVVPFGHAVFLYFVVRCPAGHVHGVLVSRTSGEVDARPAHGPGY